MSDDKRYELAVVPEIVTDDWVDPPRYDEPNFDTEEQLILYREKVEEMEAEASILPGVGTAVGMVIRKVARDYVVGLIADKGDTRARKHERDTRMIQGFKMLFEQAARADLEHALRTEFVLGLVTELMRILDAELSDELRVTSDEEAKALRVRVKELNSAGFVIYTEGYQGRISR